MQRAFLGWNAPALPRAADFLLDRAPGRETGSADLSGFLVATPGGRAGRRLLELLVERAGERRLRLAPPELVTVGRLPEKLYEPRRPPASGWVQQFAWCAALRQLDPAVRREAIPELPAEGDAGGWLALGRMLQRRHEELAGDGLDFAETARRGAKVPGFEEADRWKALAALEAAYLAQLDRLELWDFQTARLVAIREKECRTERQVVLVGAADLPLTLRRMLDTVADQVTALVFAPAELADHFDSRGCVLPEKWEERPIELAEEQIVRAEGPEDQAREVARALAALHGEYSAEQITVGVPDSRLERMLERQLAQLEVPTRSILGESVRATPLFKLLEGIADLLRFSRFPEFAALVRHPDLLQWLADRSLTEELLTELDNFAGERLPWRLGEEMRRFEQLDEAAFDQEEPGEEKQAARVAKRRERRRKMYRVYDEVRRWLADLLGPPRKPAEWMRPLADVVAAVYDRREFHLHEPADRRMIAALERFRGALLQLGEVPEELVPQLSARDALELILEELADQPIPPPAEQAAVELLGWLELPLDDAPVLAVTSFHEGVVPSSGTADLFLPDRFRRALEIEDNRRRYARDAYALTWLTQSRPVVTLIVGKRDTEQNPVIPSRLLFATDPETAARRVRRLFAEGSGAARLLWAGPAPRETGRFVVPRPEPIDPPQHVSPTAFKLYLDCPYRYYLSRRLYLNPLSDDLEELDPLAYGSLLHEVLRRFGEQRNGPEESAEGIRERLLAELEVVVGEQFGEHPRPVVAVQVAQARRRLEAFARVQAEWGREWEIRHVEVDLKFDFEVDGEPMPIKGRIDRIDRCRRTGEWCVFDYKSGDTVNTPEKAHFTKSRGWIDLQLPLYRHMARALPEVRGEVRLGYIRLPKKGAEVGFALAEWDNAELEAADETAREVIRKIRAGVYWPPREPGHWPDDYSGICQENVFGRQLAEPA